MISLFCAKEKRNVKQRTGQERYCLVLIINRKIRKKRRFKRKPNYKDVINFVNKTALPLF